ncbi:DHH family phosphoesterase [Clostridium tarantellae]|uniref:Bifunctional oligoribonuclease/PAP phosphatase NrnA n=1 Tax=Clostridium tarantellae TaxID=39493 RepID=A0A6I1MJU6_9CLOT|nr:bifunctional oligoribonuclease/PAP phosphatase NrnA [Clostridium tarantellae]MPQ42417.1 bifunctional oligoribonuclease/PAP phosphatase NrnA [Clostridium tarantellae]
MRLHDVIKAINENNKFAITYHVSPDGDALGSALALLQGIRSYGKEAYVISKDVVADNLSFLPYAEEINGETVKPTDDTNCVIVVDCGNAERVSADLVDFKGIIINIDHHLSNDNYGNVNYIDTNAAATAEIIYDILIDLGVEITEDISKCIYTSLVTDTGSFRYSNATEKTHNIVGALLNNNINHDAIHRKIFDNKPYDKMKLLALVLSDMELVCNNKIVIMRISKAMIDSIDSKIEDSSDIVSLGNQIKGVEGAVLLKEVEEGVKVSLRSKEDLDMRKIAETFGGGGHTKASGGFLKNKSLDEAKNIIIKLLEKELVK